MQKTLERMLDHIATLDAMAAQLDIARGALMRETHEALEECHGQRDLPGLATDNGPRATDASSEELAGVPALERRIAELEVENETPREGTLIGHQFRSAAERAYAELCNGELVKGRAILGRMFGVDGDREIRTMAQTIKDLGRANTELQDELDAANAALDVPEQEIPESIRTLVVENERLRGVLTRAYELAKAGNWQACGRALETEASGITEGGAAAD